MNENENKQEQQIIEQEQSPTASDFLIEKVAEVKDIVQTIRLLQFLNQEDVAVKQSLSFLIKLHSKRINTCLSHPHAQRVPELVQFAQEQMNKLNETTTAAEETETNKEEI